MWQRGMWYTWTNAVRVPYGYVAEFEALGGGSKTVVEGLPHEDFGEY